MNWQSFVEWLVLAISIFNTISLFWLGILVWLRGDKRLAGTWLISLGMVVGGILFTSHTAIFGQGIGKTSFGMNFWWWVSWLPAVLAPACWYLSINWYAPTGKKLGQGISLGSGLIVVLAVIIFWALVFINPVPTYDNIAGNEILPTPRIAGMPVLIAAYLLYVLFCFLLPLYQLRSGVDKREDQRDDRQRRAGPWLAFASVSFLVFGVILVGAAVWAVFSNPLPTLKNPANVFTVMLYDLASCISVGTGITLLGRAIVAYEVFTGRPLPRVGFFQHWRSTVLVASGFGALVAALVIFDVRSLYSLMLITLLMTGLYALFSWREFTERDKFMLRLKPYVENLNLYPQLLDTEPPDYRKIQEFFVTLCQDVLGVGQAVLVPSGSLATLTGPKLSYNLSDEKLIAEFDDIAMQINATKIATPQKVLRRDKGQIALVIPLRKDDNLLGMILCGGKVNHTTFTQEEIEIAQAGGERILDMMAALSLSEMIIDLLRDRLVQTHVIEGQGRHLLHDEILPELHTAILTLSRMNLGDVQPVIGNLSSAHRKISNLLHDVLPAPPMYLSTEGLGKVLGEMVRADYQATFASVNWHWLDDVDKDLQDLPSFVIEILYYAIREIIRNAVLHAGYKPGMVNLWIKAGYDYGLAFHVIDDGTGLIDVKETDLRSSKTGLKFHSAMLAVIGATLDVNNRSEGGVDCMIRFPATALARWKSAKV